MPEPTNRVTERRTYNWYPRRTVQTFTPTMLDIRTLPEQFDPAHGRNCECRRCVFFFGASR